jgi:hypothetical protein
MPTAFSFVLVFHWLDPLVYVTGIAVTIWAYILSRKLGYLFVAVYFLLALWSTSLEPALNRMRTTQWDAQRETEISPEAHAQFMQEYSALLQKYYPPNTAAPATISLRFPFGPVLLVFALWTLANLESRKIGEQSPTPSSQSPGLK